MEIKELLDSGRLDEAVEGLNQRVKSNPTDNRLRVSLFELLCFQGAFERAAKQLNVISTQAGKIETEAAVQLYHNMIAAEGIRHQVFNDTALPKFFLPPPGYVDRYVVVVKKIVERAENLADLVAEAEEAFPALKGQLDDRGFEGFRDGDDRIAPILEVIQGSSYLWLPFEQIKRLEITKPQKLRDLIWTHATLETTDKVEGDVFLPVLYPGTALQKDPQVRLGRMTQWLSLDDKLVYGVGQKTFLVDDREVSLLDIGSLEFESGQELPS